MNEGIETLSFQQWLLNIGKSERTAKSYAGAIENAISNWAIDSGIISNSLVQVREPSQFHALIEPIQQLPTFQEKNVKGKGMYSAALRQYAEFLDDHTGQAIREDIEQILSDSSITTTDKTVLVNTRIGQGKFRSQLIDQWQGCAVTGYRDSRFLVASHIKPWKVSNNEERLSQFNGLLLMPNIDKVFDLGYISFDESGKVRFSEQLDDPQALGIEPAMSVSLTDNHQRYMDYHRNEVFKP